MCPGVSLRRSFLRTVRRYPASLRSITPEAAYLAERTFLHYRREGGPRKTLIPNFLMAAHAAVQADRLTATDRGYLRRYFPRVPLVNPG